MHARRFRATAVVLLAAGLAALILSVRAGAANSSKPYSIKVCGGGESASDCTSAHPGVIAPDGNADPFHPPSSVTVIFTNDNKPGSGIQLGSDNLNVPSTPAGFSVISVSLPQGNAAGACPPTFNNSAPPCFVFLPDGGVGFRNLNLPPGQSMTINMTAATPAPTACTTTTSCLWTDEAKQSNNFSGTGNDLNSDGNSSYDTLTGAAASCTKNNKCSTTLDNGGTPTSAGGSISTTVSTSSGKTAVTQVESIDFGPPLAQDPTPPPPHPPCSGVTSPHLTSDTLANGADNGADRSQTITIKTTDFGGYVAQACFETNTQFTQLILAADGKTPLNLAAADPTTLPDGSPGFVGLLPDCLTSPRQRLQVNCGKNPGVSQRQTNADGTHTLVAQIPPGFDSRIGN